MEKGSQLSSLQAQQQPQPSQLQAQYMKTYAAPYMGNFQQPQQPQQPDQNQQYQQRFMQKYAGQFTPYAQGAEQPAQQQQPNQQYEQYRQQYMHQYAEQYMQQGQETQYGMKWQNYSQQYPGQACHQQNAPQDATLCHTMHCLNRWRHMQIDCLQSFMDGAVLGHAVQGVSSLFRAQAERITSEVNMSSSSFYNSSTHNRPLKSHVSAKLESHVSGYAAQSLKSHVSANASHSLEKGSALGANYSHSEFRERATVMLAGSGTLTSNMNINKFVVFAAAFLVGGSLTFAAINAKRSQSEGEAEQYLLQP